MKPSWAGASEDSGVATLALADNPGKYSQGHEIFCTERGRAHSLEVESTLRPGDRELPILAKLHSVV